MAVFSPNYRTRTGEIDRDRNGMPDRFEGDRNENGIKDFQEGDLDGNGLVDPYELDNDGDGIPDYLAMGQTGCMDPRVSLDQVLENARVLVEQNEQLSNNRVIDNNIEL